MRFKLDRRYLKYSFYASITIALAILFYQILNNFGYLLNLVSNAFTWLKRLLHPFIIGVFIAYILNPGVRWFEKNAYNKIEYIAQRKRLHRNISILTVYIILFGLVASLIIFVAPQISNNIRDMLRRLPAYVNITNRWVEYWIEDIGLENIRYFTDYIEANIKTIFDSTGRMLQYILDNLFVSILSITSGVFNYVLGLIISLYMLTDKESFKLAIDKVLRLIMRDENVKRIKDFAREADELFGKFVLGKSIDSFIIGVLCFIGLKILKIRYALLLSTIVGITNMIPYFGPFIGWVPAVFITLFDNPVNALWVSIFILGLQQFDGLILGPRILGTSVGIRPMWIVFSIVIGGKLAGVLGMFLGVPIFSIIRLLVIRGVDRGLEIKEMKRKDNKNGQESK